MLFLHILAIGIWTGCLVSEVILERSRIKNSKFSEYITKLHYTIDLWLELPAIALVLISGFSLLDLKQLHGWFLTKIIFALLAISANLTCIFFVIVRKKALLQGNQFTLQKYHDFISVTGWLGIPCGLIAFIIGLTLFET